ncbi:GTP cyclohydrolase II [Paenibacillus xylanexedens]|uniref:GTP cyclohydrolase II n=1 Tax=Paenibacillus xylanexedens TaxID=528191 RepID=A0ABS4RSF8_PAEXY|nr:GTP cyclohydrolase II [Paenibacillus xylanexedens]MBP2245828.1 GTP cyclohydrolase II [Paenibacillus xylanexedens]
MKTNIKTGKDKTLLELEKKFTVIKEKGHYLHLYGPVYFPIILNYKRYVFNWYVWHKSEYSMTFQELLMELKSHGAERNYNSILTYGNFQYSDNPLVRIHSCCFTGDVFGSTRCDCGPQLHHSLGRIIDNESGAVVYLDNHEGRGIGLFAKAIANTLQEAGYDTYESNNILDFEDDERSFDEAVTILKHFRGLRGISLLSNNRDKLLSLEKDGVVVNGLIRLCGFENEDNKRYLYSKQQRVMNYI